MSGTGHLPELESLRSQLSDLARALAERDQAILELQRRLSLTQFAVDHAQDGILRADDSNRFIYANEAARRSLGYSNEELLTLSTSDISPYGDPLRFQQRLDYLKKSTIATYESVHRRKDRTEFPVEVSVNYLEHEGRTYTCKIVRDITERKRIEQERLQVLHHPQNIMETVPDFMFTLDTQGNLVNWNRRVGEVTGYSPEELLDKPALAFVPPEQQTRMAAAIQQAFTEGYVELDGLLLTKDLRTIPYHWTGARLNLTSYADDDSVLAAGLAGAHGYVLKEIDSAALIHAVHTVAEGQSILDPTVTEQALHWLRELSTGPYTPGTDPLSTQEERVVALVAEGKTNKEIASALGLSDKTVKNYLANVFQKLRITRRAQAAAFFLKSQH